MANDITAYNRAYDDVLRRVSNSLGVVVALLDNHGLDRYLSDALNAVYDDLSEARELLEALETSDADTNPTENQLAQHIDTITRLVKAPGVERASPDLLEAATLLARTLQDVVADMVDQQAPDQTEPAHEV